MNILYVSPFSHGVNISPILNIAHLIANKGHEIHFYTVKKSYMEFQGLKPDEIVKVPNNVHMHYIENRFLISTIAYPFINPIKAYHDLKNIIENYDIDLIHFNFPEHLICLPLLKKKDLNVPVVISINGVPGYDWFYGNKCVDFIGKLYSRVLSFSIIKKADLIIPLSPKVTNTLISNGFDSNKVINISSHGGSYGVDTELFKPVTTSEKIKFRDKYGLPKDSFIMIYAGRLVRLKRLDIMLNLFGKLKSKISNFFILIVGDGPEKENLIEFSKKNSIYNIKFIDFVNQNDLKELYVASDVFILISTGEGNPASLMEACSSGLPSIVSDVGVNSNIIQEGVNGFVIDNVKDLDLMANKIIHIKENHKKFSDNARKIALKNFTWNHIIQNHIKLYNFLITRKNNKNHNISAWSNHEI